VAKEWSKYAKQKRAQLRESRQFQRTEQKAPG
jgi:hypothetical protein